MTRPTAPGSGGAPRRERKRSDSVMEALKDWITEHQLRPGDRLPQEKDLLEQFNASKGTIREALKGLESQGLVVTRTGPGGGAFVADVPPDHAMSLLSNYFYFKDITIHDIYQLRVHLEPEMAASVVGRLTPEDFDRLQTTMTIYHAPPTTQEEEHNFRLAELSFHEVLVSLCPNPILSFTCHFLLGLLKNLRLCHDIYDLPNPELWETGKHYQMQLLEALKREDEPAVRQIMREHMLRAEALMEAQETIVLDRFH
ncbi:FadR family transcriptional regulator [Natronospirillum operosum]|uniref:FadR family transcriptional regulator n=1 Tax=Natronospirillum operosum TaxID=2759953 RepID=A0A4Z0W3N2_9GAMM|nr:FCD domain-containing protein [Natronospirillum operosum]TGG91332.1 FadR family transcriptional regulator [Natronospirillum operosum]